MLLNGKNRLFPIAFNFSRKLFKHSADLVELHSDFLHFEEIWTAHSKFQILVKNRVTWVVMVPKWPERLIFLETRWFRPIETPKLGFRSIFWNFMIFLDFSFLKYVVINKKNHENHQKLGKNWYFWKIFNSSEIPIEIRTFWYFHFPPTPSGSRDHTFVRILY